MQDMMRLYAEPGAPAMPTEATLVLNTDSGIIRRIDSGAYGDNTDAVVREVWSLALLSGRPLEASEMKELLENSYRLLEKL